MQNIDQESAPLCFSSVLLGLFLPSIGSLSGVIVSPFALYSATFSCILFLLLPCIHKYGWIEFFDWSLPSSWTKSEFLREFGKLLFQAFTASIILSFATIQLLQLFGINDTQVHPVFLNLQNEDFREVCKVLFIAVVIAPVFEEVLYRLLFYRCLKGTGIPRPAFVVALIFAVAHFLPKAIPAYFVLSLFLQYARKTGGLRLSIAVHAAYNLLMLLFFFLGTVLNAF